MIRRLQRLSSKRGFTMIELIVVIAIIAILTGTVLFGSNNRREKVQEANVAAADFYLTLQAELMNFQMFDGPLTMTLQKKYADLTNLKVAGGGFKKYGGIKYYPFAGGNYPFDGRVDIGETHLDGKPKTTVVYLRFVTKAGRVQAVSFNEMIENLMTVAAGNTDAELSLVLKQEMDDRINYLDGYYYARISYTAPTNVGATSYDYRANSVKVDWVVYAPNPMLYGDSSTYSFQESSYLLSHSVCGVHASTEHSNLGTAGSSVLDPQHSSHTFI